MAAGRLEDIGERKPVLNNRIAGNRTRHGRDGDRAAAWPKTQDQFWFRGLQFKSNT
jgi:hypothetical protein